MAFSKIVLSGSTNGRGIFVTGTLPSTASLIHTAITGTADYDEVYIYIVNNATTNRECVLRWAVTTANVTDVPQRNINYLVTQQSGPVLAVPGWPLMDANRIEAYATAAMATSGGIAIYGYAHRVT